MGLPNSPDAVDLLADVLDGYVRRDSEPWGIYTREFVRKTHDWKVATAQVQTRTATAHAEDPSTLVLDNLHRVAFRGGLGNPLYPTVANVDVGEVIEFAGEHLIAPKTALVGYGVNHQDLTEAASHFLGAFAKSNVPTTATSRYFGGEHFEEAVVGDGVHIAVAFPGAASSSDDFFAAQVLRQLLGATEGPSVKYGKNHSLLASATTTDASVEAFSLSYSDAGLFGLYGKGDSSEQVTPAVQKAVAMLKEVASGSFGPEGGVTVKRAVEAAKRAYFDRADASDRLSKVQYVHGQVRI